jgi:glucokinase-like ROK family protein
MNAAVIMDQLRRFGPLSRAEIAARTGLNRSTVSSIVSSLIDDGLLREMDPESARIGRPATPLEIDPSGGSALGLEIGVDFLSALLTDFTGEAQWSRRVHVDPTTDQIAVIDAASSMLEEGLRVAVERGLRPSGIGVGVPGLVDVKRGVLMLAPNLHWENVPLRLMFAQRFGLPVFVENEANAAALGEYYFGAARGVDNFVYVSAGVGLGSGIIIDGKLFRGNRGYAGEIGHITVDPDGDLCGCGKRGCLETLIGPRAVVKRVVRNLESGAVSSLLGITQGDPSRLDFEDVASAAHSGDPLALGAIQEVGRALGMAIADLMQVFNPQLIVLGGVLNLASEELIPVIERCVQSYALSLCWEEARVIPSAHGIDACVRGAVAMVLDDVLREPLSN